MQVPLTLDVFMKWTLYLAHNKKFCPTSFTCHTHPVVGITLVNIVNTAKRDMLSRQLLESQVIRIK